MRRLLILAGFSLCLNVGAQVPSVPTELGSSPFVIQNRWVIGGDGAWNSVVVDTASNRLLIAHHSQVQAVDIESGSLVATLDGFRGAHSIALDANGSYGFVSDTAANSVVVFNRTTLEKIAMIPASNPGAVLFDANDGLVLAISSVIPPSKSDVEKRISTEMPMNQQKQIHLQKGIDDLNAEIKLNCTNNAIKSNKTPSVSENQGTVAIGSPAYCEVKNKFFAVRKAQLAELKADLEDLHKSFKPQSFITVISAQNLTVLGVLVFPGYLGEATVSGDGHLYVASLKTEWNDWGDGILHIDFGRIANSAEFQSALKVDLRGDRMANIDRLSHALKEVRSNINQYSHFGSAHGIEYLSLGNRCAKPASLAVDSHHNRLYVACQDSGQVDILNAQSGSWMQTLDAGHQVAELKYDEARSQLFAATGWTIGQLTVIREHVTNSYAVVQNLPTMQGASHMAIDPTSGRVYLLAAIYGATPPVRTTEPTRSPPGPGTLAIAPIDASFQVVVIGN